MDEELIYWWTQHFLVQWKQDHPNDEITMETLRSLHKIVLKDYDELVRLSKQMHESHTQEQPS